MFLDQDQMYLRMCNVNKKKKDSLENLYCSFSSFNKYPYLSYCYLARHLRNLLINYQTL